MAPTATREGIRQLIDQNRHLIGRADSSTSVPPASAEAPCAPSAGSLRQLRSRGACAPPSDGEERELELDPEVNRVLPVPAPPTTLEADLAAQALCGTHDLLGMKWSDPPVMPSSREAPPP